MHAHSTVRHKPVQPEPIVGWHTFPASVADKMVKFTLWWGQITYFKYILLLEIHNIPQDGCDCSPPPPVYEERNRGSEKSTDCLQFSEKTLCRGWNSLEIFLILTLLGTARTPIGPL